MMAHFKYSALLALSLSLFAHAAPAAPLSSPTLTGTAPGPAPTVPYASDDPNVEIYPPNINDPGYVPEPIRGKLGSNILAQHNIPLALENPTLLAPPTTDHGSIPNAHWPFSLSHNRLQTGGWARQQNVNEMPFAKNLAGVDMRLEAGAIRELHWHSTAEWAYVLDGTMQITTVTPEGQNYIGTIHPGDLWYFPPGQPHSLQATADNPQGAEFLLVFDNGTFNEGATFLLTDWLAHVPKEVIAKNFQTSIAAFERIPDQELYIFPSNPPPDDQQPPTSPYGTTPEPYTYEFSKVPVTQVPGGTFKIADSTTFKVSKTIAVAEFTVEPGALRELHWHPTFDEWTYFLEGQGRMTLFAAESNARTFDYQAGDIGYVPASYGHYIENTGNTTLKFLEIFKTDRFQDVSLSQWLALTPPELVKAHLGISDETVQHLSKTKPMVVAPYTPAEN